MRTPFALCVGRGLRPLGAARLTLSLSILLPNFALHVLRVRSSRLLYLFVSGVPSALFVLSFSETVWLFHLPLW